jgi:hypothetical protein
MEDGYVIGGLGMGGEGGARARVRGQGRGGDREGTEEGSMREVGAMEERGQRGWERECDCEGGWVCDWRAGDDKRACERECMEEEGWRECMEREGDQE